VHDLLAQARIETDLGNYAAAATTLAAAIEADGATPAQRAEALVRLGVARRGLGDQSGALDAFERAARAPGIERESKALLVQALGGALPGAGRWAEIWARVEFTPDRSDPQRPTLAVVWPDVAPRQHYSGQPIAVDFKDADIQGVLRLVADVSGLNVVVFPGVRGRVTLKAEQQPWDRVLDDALAANGLAYLLEDNVLLVSRPEVEPAAALDQAGDVVRLEDAGCWQEGKFPLISASAQGGLAGLPRLYFRSSSAASYSYVDMTATGGSFVGRLPKPRASASPTGFYAQVVTVTGRRVRTPERSAAVVGDPSACPPGTRLAAPGPEGAVTVFSVPPGLPPRRRYSGRRIEVDASARDLREVLSEMAAAGGARLDIDPGVEGRVTLRLKQVRWDQAFDVVARLNGLDWTEDGANRRVFPRR
jgi:hypothetical protein